MTEYEKLQERCWLLERRIKQLKEEALAKDALRRRIKTSEQYIRELSKFDD